MRNVLIAGSAGLLASLSAAAAYAAQPNPNVPSYSPYAIMEVPPAPTWNSQREGRSAFIEPGGGYDDQRTYDNAYPNATSAPGMGNPSNY